MVPGLGDDVDILFGTLFGAKRIKLVNLVAAPERISVVQNIIVLLIYMLKLGDLFYYQNIKITMFIQVCISCFKIYIITFTVKIL